MLEELQIAIDGPTEGASLGLSRDSVVRFNWQTNALVDFCIRELGEWKTGAYKKVAILLRPAPEPTHEDRGDVLLVRRLFNPATFSGSSIERRLLFKQIVSSLKEVAEVEKWDLRPVDNLERAEHKVHEPHVFSFGRSKLNSSRNRSAQGIVMYGDDFFELRARINGRDSLLLMRGEYGRTYWSDIAPLLGGVYWIDPDKVGLIDKKGRKMGGTYSALVSN